MGPENAAGAGGIMTVSVAPDCQVETFTTYADVATVGPLPAGPIKTTFSDVFTNANPEPLITTRVPPAALPLDTERPETMRGKV